MKNFLSYYTEYTNNINEYNNLNSESELKSTKRKAEDVLKNSDEKILKSKARAIAEPLLVSDYYEHEKAEDSETFFQTYNIELMSAATALASIPTAVTKVIPFLEKHSQNNIAKNLSEKLKSYKNASINIAGKSIKVSKVLTAAMAVISGIIYAAGMKNSMKSQLGLIRKASFDSTKKIINDPKMFAILTPEQEEQIEKITDSANTAASVVDKIKDKVDLKSSFSSVGDYKRNYAGYVQEKEEYKKSLEPKTGVKFSEEELKEARENQQLHENFLKNVELDPLEKLRKIETISNISYSALFTGGFLEYLITDKLVDVLHVTNKPLQYIMKLGVPLLTYFLLNKNISDIENKAILATKYKHIKEFTENPAEYNTTDKEGKQNPIEFIKSVAKDMKDYEEFSSTELPKIKSKLEAKKLLELTPEQERTAKLLQKNTSMTLNEHRENVYNQSVGIKSLSETILGPVDIMATAAGGFLGAKVASALLERNPNSKAAGLCKGLGAVITFIPAAILEAKLTKQQKLSEKTAAAMTINSFKDERKFLDNSASNIFSDIKLTRKSRVFEEFQDKQ